jgi:hypothetical protein
MKRKNGEGGPDRGKCAKSQSLWLTAQKGSWVQIKVADLPKWNLGSNQGG